MKPTIIYLRKKKATYTYSIPRTVLAFQTLHSGSPKKEERVKKSLISDIFAFELLMMASLVLLQGIYTDKGITFGICVGGDACSFTQEFGMKENQFSVAWYSHGLAWEIR